MTRTRKKRPPKGDQVENIRKFSFYALPALIVIPLSVGMYYAGFSMLKVAGIVVLFGILAGYLGFKLMSGVENLGSAAFGSRSWRGLREQLAGELEVVKICIRNGRHQEALERLRPILEKDPEYPEALALAARALWEGHRDRDGARECLRRALDGMEDNHPLVGWARAFYRDLTENEPDGEE